MITPLAHPGQWDDDPISANAYRRADLVVATSATDASVYEALGVEEEALAICPLPTAPPTLGNGAQLRRERDLDGPIVLFLGARMPYKGVPELLVAASAVRKVHPDAVIAFVGPGEPLSEDRPSNTLDIGAVDDLQKDAWLDASDIVCLPSASESFGLTISEAWSARKPVVTSDLPVLAERVASAGGGLAVPRDPASLADAINALLSSPTLGTELGESGYRYWETTSSPSKYVQWHLAQYRRLAR